MRRAFGHHRATYNFADRAGLVHAAHVYGATWCGTWVEARAGGPTLPGDTVVTCLWCVAGLVAW